MDPIKNGVTIFKNFAESLNSQKITQLPEIDNFFSELIRLTNGLIILDFLDTKNWDIVESYKIQDDRLLTLVWHDFRTIDETEEEKEVRQWMFPASLYSLGISINSIVPIITEQSAFFLINGYSITEKEINRIFKNGCTEYKIYNNSFFEKRIVRKIGEHWEVMDYHCTPIYSLAIIPKRSGLDSSDSKRLLYIYNILDLDSRMEDVNNALKSTDSTNHDLICEKVNTARRIFESVLKIESCYREIKIKQDYSKILLGPLINNVKGFYDEEYIPVLGKIAELLNEFSHDSGKQIDKEKAEHVCILVLEYIKKLFILITESRK